MRREQIERFARETLDAERVTYDGRWGGFEVWTPIWDGEPPCIGPPAYILVRGESIRLTEPDEGYAILREWVRTHPDAERARTGPNRSQTLYPPFSY